jgi:hypothetical protein
MYQPDDMYDAPEDMTEWPMKGEGRDANIFLDTSDLSGDPTPIALDAFIEINEENPLLPEEVEALRALPVGGKAHLGIGGGEVVIVRVR